MSEPSAATSDPPTGPLLTGHHRVAALLLGGLRSACMLLTRLPVGGAVAPEARRWAAAFIPLVGLGLGVLGGGAMAAFAPQIGPRLAAALALGLLLLVTGALHEDGLADTADALGGARSRERLFAILKDSRLGTYGVLALVVSILVRVEALAELGPRGPACFALAAVLSRAPMVWLMAALPYVTPEHLARSADLVRVPAGAVLTATGTAVGVLAAAVGLGALSVGAAVLALGATVAMSALAGWRFHQRAGGITGDFLGAAQQVCELTVLLALLAAR